MQDSVLKYSDFHLTEKFRVTRHISVTLSEFLYTPPSEGIHKGWVKKGLGHPKELWRPTHSLTLPNITFFTRQRTRVLRVSIDQEVSRFPDTFRPPSQIID
jgi:hypothetical protein